MSQIQSDIIDVLRAAEAAGDTLNGTEIRDELPQHARRKITSALDCLRLKDWIDRSASGRYEITGAPRHD